MAYSITQQPTSPNGTLSDLVYVVSSTNNGETNFRYIADVYYSGGSEYLTRLKAYQNTNGDAVFNLASVINDYLVPEDDRIWDNAHTDYSSNPNGQKDFVIKFGEEYGTTVTVYANQATSNTLAAFPAVVDPDAGSYNFPSASYTNTAGNVRLSNYPYSTSDNSKYTKLITANDYETISFLNHGNQINSITKRGSGGTVSMESGTLTDTIVTVGVGPANFTTGAPSVGSSNGIYYIDVDFDGGADNLYYYFQVVEECNYDRVRFAFTNKFGMWDYFGVNLPETRTTSITRKSFKQSFVDYSGTTSPYNISNRGHKQYLNKPMDSFSVTTEYIQQGEADWLSEIFESNNVLIQNSLGTFEPIVITNASYTWKTNARQQKVFQYTINYNKANNRRSIF
jgi:hypothetical protein